MSPTTRTSFFHHPLTRTAGAALATAGLVVGLAGCGSTSSGGSAKSGTIYVVPGLTTEPAYRTMYCSAAAEAKKLGYKVSYTGATTWDPSLQIPIVQSLLAKSPKALLLTPTDGEALAPVVKQYTSANIPVVAMDTTLNDPSGLTSQVSSSNEQGGAAAADALIKAVGTTGTVAIISGAPGASTDAARVKGFVDEMKAKAPGLKVLEPQFSKSVVATAESQVQALMLKYPDLVGVFGVNGNSATGAANAVDNAGKKGKITIAGYDAEPATVEQLKAGNIAILVVQDFATEGKLGLKYAVAALTGKDKTIEKKVALKNVIATTANANDPQVSKYYYVDKCS